MMDFEFRLVVIWCGDRRF